jgi:RND family efflux transporter MFP subunit
MRIFAALIAILSAATSAVAGDFTVAPVSVPELKAVYGRVEARTTVAARARIGGTVTELHVSEGDDLTAGQLVATVRDEKLEFRIKAVDAQLLALSSQLKNALVERDRGRKLLQSGVSTKQRQDALQTQVDVLENQISEAKAQRELLLQQGDEGAVQAPLAGKVLSVPVSKGVVIMPGETIANLAVGGFYLRLSIPERHSSQLREGETLEISSDGGTVNGILAKVYPEIEAGRVTADVEVQNLPTRFVNARLLVRVPVGERQALMIPAAAVTVQSGLDFVTRRSAAGEQQMAVVIGERRGDSVEILSGVSAGDVLVVP